MRLISAAALLLLAACSQGTEQPSNEVGNSPQPEPASTAPVSSLAPSRPSDPLAEAAVRAQRALLESNAAEASAISDERDARAAILGRVNLNFRGAMVELRDAGVAFDKAQAAVNILNVTRRQQGVFELQTTYQDSDDQFRIVDDFMTGEPFGIVLLRGTNHPQSFRGWLRGEILGGDGRISASCRVGVPSGSGEKLLPCRAVVTGEEDGTLTDLAKAYLTTEMR